MIGYIRGAVSRGVLPAEPQWLAKLGSYGKAPHAVGEKVEEAEGVGQREDLAPEEAGKGHEDIGWWQRIRHIIGIRPG